MDNETVAMILASKGIIPPKQWEHNKFPKIGYKSVAELLSEHGIIPPL